MNSRSSSFIAFIFRALLVVTSSIFGLAGCSNCDAQSIVGKWHRTGTLSFKIDKATGKQTPLLSAEQQKQYDQATAANEYNELLEFKSDDTYISIVSAKDMKATEHTEKYSISGNKLNMNIPPYQNEKTTITIKSVDGTTMILDFLFMSEMTEVIYTKI
jgi:type VI protein secretion system component VasA